MQCKWNKIQKKIDSSENKPPHINYKFAGKPKKIAKSLFSPKNQFFHSYFPLAMQKCVEKYFL